MNIFLEFFEMMKCYECCIDLCYANLLQSATGRRILTRAPTTPPPGQTESGWSIPTLVTWRPGGAENKQEYKNTN